MGTGRGPAALATRTDGGMGLVGKRAVGAATLRLQRGWAGAAPEPEPMVWVLSITWEPCHLGLTSDPPGCRKGRFVDHVTYIAPAGMGVRNQVMRRSAKHPPADRLHTDAFPWRIFPEKRASIAERGAERDLGCHPLLDTLSEQPSRRRRPASNVGAWRQRNMAAAAAASAARRCAIWCPLLAGKRRLELQRPAPGLRVK